MDPHYLEWKAREYNFTTRFIGLAGEINRRMPEFVREKVLRVLNNLGKAPSKSCLLYTSPPRRAGEAGSCG